MSSRALKIGECRMSSCTAYAWSPDSRQFLCAVTAPRMKVDNKITIFKHNGLELFTVPFSGDLYRPAPLRLISGSWHLCRATGGGTHGSPAR